METAREGGGDPRQGVVHMDDGAVGGHARRAPRRAEGGKRIARGVQRVGQRVNLLPGQQIEFELVGRHDVGGGNRLGRNQRGQLGPHEDAAPHVAHHRVAAVQRRRVGLPHPVHRRHHELTHVGKFLKAEAETTEAGAAYEVGAYGKVIP